MFSVNLTNYKKVKAKGILASLFTITTNVEMILVNLFTHPTKINNL